MEIYVKYFAVYNKENCKDMKEKFDEVQRLHNITVTMLQEANNLPGELYKEYNRGLDQYENMLQSISMFASTAKTEEAKESLKGQQSAVLEKMIQFELDMQAKIKENTGR